MKSCNVTTGPHLDKFVSFKSCSQVREFYLAFQRVNMPFIYAIQLDTIIHCLVSQAKL